MRWSHNGGQKFVRYVEEIFDYRYLRCLDSDTTIRDELHCLPVPSFQLLSNPLPQVLNV